MLSCRIESRRNETNATGHIDHTVIPVWFEQARTPVYEVLNPGLSLDTWNTVIRKIDIEFTGQVLHNRETEVRTFIAEVKHTSFTVRQELWQEDTLVAAGNTVLVYFDYAEGRKQTIPDTIRKKLLTLPKG